MAFPEGEPWLHYADSLPFPVEVSSRMHLIPPAKASKDVSRRLAHGLLELDLPVYGGEPGPDLAHIVCVGDVLSEQHDCTSHASLQDLYGFLMAHGVKLSIRRGILRFSFHVYNDESDVERTLSLVKAWRDAHSTGKRSI